MQKIALVLFFLGSLFLYSSMGCQYVVRKETKFQVEERDLAEEKTTTETVRVEDLSQKNQLILDSQHEEEPLLPKEKVHPPKDIFTFRRGVYLHNQNSRNLKKLKEFVEKAKQYELNAFVLDVQPKMVPRENVEFLLENQITPIARVVVFQGGLKEARPNPKYLEKIFQIVQSAIENKFVEIQLDYIRYADEPALNKVSLRNKYQEISSILSKAKEITAQNQVALSADVFGRITLNKDDTIGQKLELFGQYVDIICPMLYPSHYYYDQYRMANPLETLKEGVANTKSRLPHIRVVPYVQAFAMGLRYAKLTLPNYILQELRGLKEGGADGFILWNAHNDYAPAFKALLLEKKDILAKAQ